MQTNNYYSPFLPEKEDFYEEWESDYSRCELLESLLILAISNGDVKLTESDGVVYAEDAD